MVELLTGLRPEYEFLEELGLISAEDLPLFERTPAGKEKTGDAGLAQEETACLVSPAFKMVAARDLLGLVAEVCNSEW